MVRLARRSSESRRVRVVCAPSPSLHLTLTTTFKLEMCNFRKSQNTVALEIHGFILRRNLDLNTLLEASQSPLSPKRSSGRNNEGN
jgi:hypothetical protein